MDSIPNLALRLHAFDGRMAQVSRNSQPVGDLMVTIEKRVYSQHFSQLNGRSGNDVVAHLWTMIPENDGPMDEPVEFAVAEQYIAAELLDWENSRLALLGFEYKLSWLDKFVSLRNAEQSAFSSVVRISRYEQ